MAYAGAAGVRRSQPRRKLFDKVVRELERRGMDTKVPKGWMYEDEVEKIKLVVGSQKRLEESFLAISGGFWREWRVG